MTSYLDCADRAVGGRRTIQIIDQTLRDGPQSWWGMRMRKSMGLPIAGELDRTGFNAIDLVGSSIFEVLVRHCKEDPWDQLISLSKAMPRTRVRAGTRSNGIVTFGLTADSVMDLWVQRLCAHGIGSFWIYDGLFNIDKIGRLVKVAQAHGAEAVPCILFADSPYHTDEYYAQKTRELVALGADGIELEDAAGLLTPERTRSLIGAIKKEAGDLPVEAHFHSNNALSPLNYLEAVLAGADRVHTASRPLAAGVSLPSTENTVANLRYAGFDVEIDDSRLEVVEQHLLNVAKIEELPVGRPAEFSLYQYRHQLPGGMAGTFKNQLKDRGMEHRFEEVLDEMALIRRELGYPVMATPFSQLVGTQAVLNVVTGDRYSVVPDEVLLYVNGFYGEPVAPLDQDVLDKIMDSPKAKTYAEWEPPQPELDELRAKFGKDISDDELILRLLVPEHDIEVMRATPPRTIDYGLTSRELANIRKLISTSVGAYLHVESGGFELTLHGDH
ncbi:carboxyl transferase [Mycolicibacterium thermoresistibile]|uniref:Carboxyltransferase n=2 Tax=Mycolicibacterium thermoresistibile TaxID=1797 RepID=G7CH62_MYCT3|nr:carboxyl transferase [Mycolicibacterium thermoresistibile]EHI12172.1 carboxyltransferase [Mycolicibacterium thermoresistibile ATCC 19527]MCV7191113.1 carboxyltransferase [Mycolicibacterium thermoresistibile]GAT15539.1 carboxyltransferase [Mycolicibacterium thermoresistibile]SNW16910.1 pyruvate carboxylase [Mycolicibacterium thermoresistibile]